jgi:hypothetical protein
VNLEVDVMAKYVERLVTTYLPDGRPDGTAPAPALGGDRE